MVSYNDLYYFNSLGYKVIGNRYADIIVEGFQSHAGLKADGIIGPKTRAKMAYYNKDNFCPEVFEPIKPYKSYTDKEIESLCDRGLAGLGYLFNHYSRLYDFDVLHNLAHAILESAAGTSAIARKKNNLYGWAAYDNSPMYSAHGFESYEQCIEQWSKWFNREYLKPDGKHFRGNNEYCVGVVYHTSPVASINKSFIVQDLRNKLENKNEPVIYKPTDRVPGAKDFTFKEGYSNTQLNGIRKIKVDPIPEIYMDNAIRVFQNLQRIRDHFGVPVIISSSGNLYRNRPYNIAIDGADDSRHLYALASDTYVTGVPSKTVYKWAKDNTAFKGFGIINNNWIHLDLRNTFWYKEY